MLPRRRPRLKASGQPSADPPATPMLSPRKSADDQHQVWRFTPQVMQPQGVQNA